MAPQGVEVGVELVELEELVVELVAEERAKRRRKKEGVVVEVVVVVVVVYAAAAQPPSQDPHPPTPLIPPSPLAARRLVTAVEATAGQVVAMFPALVEAAVWLAESEVRVPVTCTLSRDTPKPLKHVDTSHRTPCCVLGSTAVR